MDASAETSATHFTFLSALVEHGPSSKLNIARRPAATCALPIAGSLWHFPLGMIWTCASYAAPVPPLAAMYTLLRLVVAESYVPAQLGPAFSNFF